MDTSLTSANVTASYGQKTEINHGLLGDGATSEWTNESLLIMIVCQSSCMDLFKRNL